MDARRSFYLNSRQSPLALRDQVRTTTFVIFSALAVGAASAIPDRKGSQLSALPTPRHPVLPDEVKCSRCNCPAGQKFEPDSLGLRAPKRDGMIRKSSARHVAV